MQKRKITLGILLLFILGTFSVIGQQQINDVSSETHNTSNILSFLVTGNHEPIRIEGNDEFLPENGVTGGSGTENDPYIIEGWTIVDDNTTDVGIFINNTDVHFILRNCTIMNFTGTYELGIQFNNVINGIIQETTTYRNQIGIDLSNCELIEIRNCTSYNYSTAWFASGISCHKTNNVTITSCELYDNENGVYLSDSNYIIITDNHFWNSGRGIHSLGSSRYLDIFDNLIHDMYYGGIDITNWDEPLSYAYIHIYNNEIYNIGQPNSAGLSGIDIYNVFGTIIERCSFYNSTTAISIGIAPKTIIRNCSIFDNHYSGIEFMPGSFYPLQLNEFSTIEYCDIYNSSMGINCWASIKSRIHKNNIYNNSIGLFVSKLLVPLSLSFVRVNRNNIYDNEIDENISSAVILMRGNGDFRFNWWGTTDGPKIYPYSLDLDHRGISYGGSGNAIFKRFSIFFHRPF
ncbi:MAG: right-handed parallel beta-helix repeat-containing protein, partial [Candidatus Thermoplasmatota archaeon]|nr:right-handed parallel beta-helix repeat-containing protein [Candidatus Thermoplasmatota archaeon]